MILTAPQVLVFDLRVSVRSLLPSLMVMMAVFGGILPSSME